LAFNLKINGFPGLILEQFHVKFGILAESVFEICGTDTIVGKTLPPQLPLV